MLKRLEIIGNLSLEEDILEGFAEKKVGRHRTSIMPVHGNGLSGPCYGDPVWPEENFYLLLFLPEEDVPVVEDIIRSVRETHRGTGLACFLSECDVKEF